MSKRKLPAKSAAPTFMDEIAALLTGCDNSDASRRKLLDGILRVTFAGERSEQDIEDIIALTQILSDKEYLWQRDVVVELVLPLAYEIEDPKLIDNVAQYIADKALCDDEGGHVLGSLPTDRLIFQTLAMLLKKMVRAELAQNENRKLPSKSRLLATAFCDGLRKRPENDRGLLALLEPFTLRNTGAVPQTTATVQTLRYN